MDSLGVTFLGMIAFSSLAQAAFIVYLAVAGRRLARRIDEVQKKVDREIHPALENLSRITRNLGEISDLATLQARRIDGLLADTVEKIEDATALIQRAIIRPLGPLVDIVAFLKGIRRGLQVYHKLRGLESRGRPPSRRQPDLEDEHLFI
jgi:hypothetical protein